MTVCTDCSLTCLWTCQIVSVKLCLVNDGLAPCTPPGHRNHGLSSCSKASDYPCAASRPGGRVRNAGHVPEQRCQAAEHHHPVSSHTQPGFAGFQNLWGVLQAHSRNCPRLMARSARWNVGLYLRADARVPGNVACLILHEGALRRHCHISGPADESEGAQGHRAGGTMPHVAFDNRRCCSDSVTRMLMPHNASHMGRLGSSHDFPLLRSSTA